MSSNSIALRAAANQPPPHSPAWWVLEETERLAALVALIALAPALLLIAAVIAVLSGGPPLVAHRRVGRGGETFWVFKFRTMWTPHCKRRSSGLIEFLVDESGPDRKQPHDPRVTHWFARLCRTYSLDELPQLVHVVAGRMSFVGPRPVTRSELRQHYGRHTRAVLAAKPGLTGLWQVMGRNRLSYRQRARLDLFYVRKRSLGLYLRILARTVPQVIAGHNSW